MYIPPSTPSTQNHYMHGISKTRFHTFRALWTDRHTNQQRDERTNERANGRPNGRTKLNIESLVHDDKKQGRIHGITVADSVAKNARNLGTGADEQTDGRTDMSRSGVACP